MGFGGGISIRSTRTVISIYDDSIVAGSSDIEKYQRDYDPAHIVLDGEPVRFTIRPLSAEERDSVASKTESGADYIEALFAVATERISGLTAKVEVQEKGKTVVRDVPVTAQKVERYGRLPELAANVIRAVPPKVRAELGALIHRLSGRNEDAEGKS